MCVKGQGHFMGLAWRSSSVLAVEVINGSECVCQGRVSLSHLVVTYTVFCGV